jgi:predicted transcriptional regulator
MTIPSVEELALGERKFLHDIANHIVVAHGMATLAHKAFKETGAAGLKDIDRLERAIEAISKMTIALKERRAFLHTFTD